MSGFRFVLALLAIIAAFSGIGYLATRSHQAGWDSPEAVGRSVGAWLRGGDKGAAAGTLVTDAGDSTIVALAQDTGKAGGEWLRSWGEGVDEAPTPAAPSEPTLPQEVAGGIGRWIGGVPDAAPASGEVAEGAASDDEVAGTTESASSPTQSTSKTTETATTAAPSATGTQSGTTLVPAPTSSDPVMAEAAPAVPAAIAPVFTDMIFDQPSGPILSGTAAKGAVVTVTVDEREIGSGVADDNGQWTILPGRPIVPGEHWFGVSSRPSASSEDVVLGERRFVLVPAVVTAEAGSEAAVGDKTSLEAAGVGADGGTGTSLALNEDSGSTGAAADATGAGGGSSVPATGDATTATESTAESTAAVPAEPAPETSTTSAGSGSMVPATGEATQASESTAENASAAPAAPAPETSTATAGSGTTATPGGAGEQATTGQTGASEQEYAQASEMEKESGDFWDWDTWFGGGEDTDQAGKPPQPAAPPAGEGTLVTLPDERISISGLRYTPVGEKEGVVTMSGRGVVGSKVRLHIDGESLGEVDVAENGRWLKETSFWIAPGPHAARAALIGTDGTIVAEAAYPFSREVPAGGQESTIVATAPQPGVSTAGQTAAAEPLAFSSVRYEPATGGGKIVASGRGAVGASIKLSIDGKEAGAGKVAENGRWLIEQPLGLALGDHEATIEAVDAGGRVLGSAKMSFVAEPLPAVVASNGDGDSQPVTDLQSTKTGEAPDSAIPAPADDTGTAATGKAESTKKSAGKPRTKKRKVATAGKKRSAIKGSARTKAQRIAKASKKRVRVAKKPRRSRLVQVYVRRGDSIVLVQVPAAYVKPSGALRLTGAKAKRAKVVARKIRGKWHWLKGKRRSFVGSSTKYLGRKGKRVTVYSCPGRKLCTARRVRLR